MKLSNFKIVFLAVVFALFAVVSGEHFVPRMMRFFGKDTAEYNRSAAIEVIGAGFGRTGTMSLKHALNILGYKTYHMDEVARNGHDSLAMAAFTGEKSKVKAWFDAMLDKGFTATVDHPTCVFYKEQMAMYPNAKVVLTTRDPEKWVKSITTLFSSVSHFQGLPFTLFLDRRAFFDETILSKNSKYGFGVTGCSAPFNESEWFQPWYAPWVSYPISMTINKKECIKAFNEHNEEVRRYVPKDKLLEINIGDGWGPLAKHLGKPIPNVPFPSTNSGDSLNDMKTYLRFIAHFYPFIFAAILLVVYGVIKVIIRVIRFVFRVDKKQKVN